MFAGTERFYDLIYSWKDYPAEVERLDSLIRERKRAPGNGLLDVACGTGRHLELLRERYQVEGLDADPEMLAIAAARLPGVRLHRGDFLDFDLGRRYEVAGRQYILFAIVGGSGFPAGAHMPPGGVTTPAESKSYIAFALPNRSQNR